MAMTLYHDIPSSNSDRVKIALAEKNLSWDSVRIRLANREQKKPEFLKLNPYGKIPVLVEDGNVLFESCIINEYLEEKYPDPPLMPKDPYLRGRGRVLVDYALNYATSPTGSCVARCASRRLNATLLRLKLHETVCGSC